MVLDLGFAAACHSRHNISLWGKLSLSLSLSLLLLLVCSTAAVAIPRLPILDTHSSRVETETDDVCLNTRKSKKCPTGKHPSKPQHPSKRTAFLRFLRRIYDRFLEILEILGEIFQDLILESEIQIYGSSRLRCGS
jgi:hypothetical protein